MIRVSLCHLAIVRCAMRRHAQESHANNVSRPAKRSAVSMVGIQQVQRRQKAAAESRRHNVNDGRTGGWHAAAIELELNLACCEDQAGYAYAVACLASAPMHRHSAKAWVHYLGFNPVKQQVWSNR